MQSHPIFQNRLGERLAAAEVLVHFFQGVMNGLISYKLIFESNNTIIISCGPDGDSLKINNGDLVENDLDEFGKTKLLPVTGYDPASVRPCLGKRFDRCRLAVKFHKTYAVEFYFEGSVITFYNNDDELTSGTFLEGLDLGFNPELIVLSGDAAGV